MSQAPFDFVRMNARPPKPRTRGLTEIRGPYYTPMGPRALADLLETCGAHIDSLKFAGGAFTLMPPGALAEIVELAHRYDVAVSTGGFVEYVLTQGAEAVDRYIDTCARVGFDIVEISAGFVTLADEDWLRLVARVREAGLEARPELGIQPGAGGGSPAGALEAAGTRDPRWLVDRAGRLLDAGVPRVMIESEGITESVRAWRTDVVEAVASGLGLDRVIFEAADPAVFTWYVQTYGPDVNLFVDHSQIVQLEALRRGIWGTTATWGRILGYR